ncbi:MAG: hypothetical protein GX799_05790 [Crenarchaeota archaeon]|nr:hypothetical protein [Thermoproteota archaeon]
MGADVLDVLFEGESAYERWVLGLMMVVWVVKFVLGNRWFPDQSGGVCSLLYLAVKL